MNQTFGKLKRMKTIRDASNSPERLRMIKSGALLHKKRQVNKVFKMYKRNFGDTLRGTSPTKHLGDSSPEKPKHKSSNRVRKKQSSAIENNEGNSIIG